MAADKTFDALAKRTPVISRAETSVAAKATRHLNEINDTVAGRLRTTWGGLLQAVVKTYGVCSADILGCVGF